MKSVFMFLFLVLVPFLSVKAKENWKQVNVFKESTVLNAVDVRGDLIISVGDYGVIKSSTDFGKTWSTQQIPTVNKLNDVVIIDSQRAIAVGNKGVVLYTANSGSSWSIVDIETKYDLFDVQISDKNGIIVGQYGFLAEANGNFQDWQQTDIATDDSLNMSCVFDAKNAIVCVNNGKVLTKENGSWDIDDLDTKGNLIKIAKVDENSAFMISDKLEGFLTSDRGKTWEKIFIDDIDIGIIDKIVDLVYDDYVSVIVTRTYLSGNAAVEFISGDLTSWKKVGKGVFNNGCTNNDICFTSDMHEGIAVDDEGGVSKVDRGLSSGFLYNRINRAELRYIRDLEVYDYNNWVVLGKNLCTFRLTNDGGTTWKSIHMDLLDTLSNSYLHRAQMPEYNTVYISGEKVVFEEINESTTVIHFYAVFIKTDYEGNVLKYYEFPEKYSGSSIEFTDKNYGIFQHYYGFWFTTDGGETWGNVERDGSTRKILEIKTTAPGTIYSLEQIKKSDETYLCKSEDFGKTWTENKLALPLNEIHFKGKDTILADYTEYVTETTYKPHLVLSTDGGHSWKDLKMNIEVLPERYTFSYALYNETEIMAMCGVGLNILFHSKDLGENWSRDAFDIVEHVGFKSVIEVEVLNNKPILVCDEELLVVAQDISDVEDISDLSEAPFSIYPNPADKVLHIETNDNTEYDKVKIYSLDGKLVFDKDYLSGMSINIEELQTGNYYLVLTDKEGKQLGQKLNIVR